MKGLCHFCHCSGIETFLSKKTGMSLCANCAADEHYSDMENEK